MYINPFLAGVIATIVAEIGIMLVSSLVIIIRKGKQHD